MTRSIDEIHVRQQAKSGRRARVIHRQGRRWCTGGICRSKPQTRASELLPHPTAAIDLGHRVCPCRVDPAPMAAKRRRLLYRDGDLPPARDRTPAAKPATARTCPRSPPRRRLAPGVPTWRSARASAAS